MRTLIGILLFIFIVFPLMFGTMAVLAVATWGLDRDFYLDLVNTDDFAETILSEQIYFEDEDFQSFRDETGFNIALAVAVQEFASPEYIKTEAVSLVNRVFDFLNGAEPQPNIAIDLTPIKSQLRGEGLAQFATALVDQLPVCESDAGQQDITALQCIPANVSESEAQQIIVQNAPAFVESLPDQLNFSEIGEDEAFEMPANFSLISLITIGVAILVLVAAIFWFINGVIGGANGRSRLLWLGTMLVIAAVPILWIGFDIGGRTWVDWLLPTFSGLRFGSSTINIGTQQEIISNAIQLVISNLSSGFLTIGGIMVAIAVSLYFWGFNTRSKNDV